MWVALLVVPGLITFFLKVNFSKVIPEGLLVFFPSYAVMADCISAWRSTVRSTTCSNANLAYTNFLMQNGQNKSVWDRLNEQKQVFVEPKTKYEFSQAINGYYSRIKDPAFDGAIFMAVCRGKVSEGVDFADGRGRAVVITGIPFAHSKDPKVTIVVLYSVLVIYLFIVIDAYICIFKHHPDRAKEEFLG